jgi:hypothetical protein
MQEESIGMKSTVVSLPHYWPHVPVGCQALMVAWRFLKGTIRGISSYFERAFIEKRNSCTHELGMHRHRVCQPFRIPRLYRIIFWLVSKRENVLQRKL